MKKSNKTFIGNMFPFFLNNSNMETYYLYQVVTPGITEDLTPLLSLVKISEKVGNGDFSAVEKNCRINNGDILSTLMKNRKKYVEKAPEFLKALVSDPIDYSDMIYPNGNDFPTFELEENNNLTKTIILNLRDSLRWTRFRFQPDHYVDILVSPTKFAIFKIEGDSESIHLNPVGMFENEDVNLENPIPNVNWAKVDYPKTSFSGSKRASELNRALRQTEWRAFNN